MFSLNLNSPNRRRAAALAIVVESFLLLFAPALTSTGLAQDKIRTITADDFIKHRPGPSARSRQRRSQSNPNGSNRRYRLDSRVSENDATRFSVSRASQLGLTMWQMHPLINRDRSIPSPAWIAKRVEADTRFRPGDYVRISIECPRAGYLYVVDRDWFTDDQLGESRLIFPVRGDDNRLSAGRVITIPAEVQFPFRALPKPNQAGELLTIVVSSSPITLPLSNEPTLISTARLNEWERLWGAATERFELDGGAGQARTPAEMQASSSTQTRQLTRDDPTPQTIYLISPISNDAFLFQVRLFYAQ
jgi:Domain of unknown function (DUF4384)